MNRDSSIRGPWVRLWCGSSARNKQRTGRQWAVCDPCPEHLWLMETADRREAFRMAHERNAEMHPVAATEAQDG